MLIIKCGQQMKKAKYPIITLLTIFFVISFIGNSYPWHDETHIAIAKATGYKKWYNAAGADMLKIKAGYTERLNHYTNNPRGTIITPEMVLKQIKKYNNKTDIIGHLYGAIIASVRDYLKEKQRGKYGEYHLAVNMVSIILPFVPIISVIFLSRFTTPYIISTVVRIIKP